jgi:hypothetical protein
MNDGQETEQDRRLPDNAGEEFQRPCDKHGQLACGLCMAERAPKCDHGRPFFCGFCLGETGSGVVR